MARNLDERLTTLERELPLHIQPEVALHQSHADTVSRHLLRRTAALLGTALSDACTGFVAATLVGVTLTRMPFIGPRLPALAQPSEFCVALLLSLALAGTYRSSKASHPTLRLLIGSAFAALVVGWAGFWSAPSLLAVPVAVVLAIATAIGLSLSRAGLRVVVASLVPTNTRLIPAVVIGSHAVTERQLERDSGYRVMGHVELTRTGNLGDNERITSSIQTLARLIQRTRAESVIVTTGLRAAEFEGVLRVSLNAGCELLVVSQATEARGVQPTVVKRGSHAFIQVTAPTLLAPQLFAKRCADILGAGIACLLLAPLGLVIAIAIKLDSPGPVFFAQERVGLGGRRFRMLKFRTMRVGADAEKAQLAHLNATGDGRLFKIREDPRITRMGHILRRWSLDEVPQFLNVLGGSMSLVGPRPFFESDLADYEEHHFRRLGAKPGITGLWQVSGRSTVMSFEEVVRLDTEYIDQWSLALDMKILSRTFPAVLRKTGAF